MTSQELINRMGIDYIEFDNLGRVVVIAGKTTPRRLKGQ